MARLNEGLSLFDAILIVPMFQIVWTFFSICTGFIYFQEYQVKPYSHFFFFNKRTHVHGMSMLTAHVSFPGFECAENDNVHTWNGVGVHRDLVVGTR